MSLLPRHLVEVAKRKSDTLPIRFTHPPDTFKHPPDTLRARSRHVQAPSRHASRTLPTSSSTLPTRFAHPPDTFKHPLDTLHALSRQVQAPSQYSSRTLPTRSSAPALPRRAYLRPARRLDISKNFCPPLHFRAVLTSAPPAVWIFQKPFVRPCTSTP